MRKAFLKAPCPSPAFPSGYEPHAPHPQIPSPTPGHRLLSSHRYLSAQWLMESSLKPPSTIPRVAMCVVIHSNGYETIYNHMSKFGKTPKKVHGSNKVRSSASRQHSYATGPHLIFDEAERRADQLRSRAQDVWKPSPSRPRRCQPSALVAQFRSHLSESVKTAALQTPPLPSNKHLSCSPSKRALGMRAGIVLKTASTSRQRAVA